ncbi:class IIb bacteriocin, lactobin A/cerein 7B family [Flavobacterium hydatis]|jgi:lactobin A/cerein 7B family class IIb bacteriocin|uniref:class IIb bacteriocin, lactobin A/cerein 7B family n=1 Tax=Flavobacterium hydatis TaxID=991 RepID=UPI000AFCA9E1|nr:class IIb bacteriocin, lactobin A/cerein 7B family [Flavobacterium hydatis]
MKKQNVNNKLAFNKVAVIELNDNQMHDVDGGTTPICVGVIIGLTISIAMDN